jgi:hypothetical protein
MRFKAKPFVVAHRYAVGGMAGLAVMWVKPTAQRSATSSEEAFQAKPFREPSRTKQKAVKPGGLAAQFRDGVSAGLASYKTEGAGAVVTPSAAIWIIRARSASRNGRLLLCAHATRVALSSLDKSIRGAVLMSHEIPDPHIIYQDICGTLH